MTSEAGAGLLVRRVRGDPARVPDRGGIHPGRLPELPLRAPEAAEPEHRDLETRGERAPQRGTEDRVSVRYREGRLRAAGQRPLRRWQSRLVTSEEHVRTPPGRVHGVNRGRPRYVPGRPGRQPPRPWVPDRPRCRSGTHAAVGGLPDRATEQGPPTWS